MTQFDQKRAARDFVAFWTGKGYEKGQTQPFWIGLLRLLGVENPDRGFIEFEDKAHIDAAHGFIDGYVPATHVLIEQKSLGKNLRAGIQQSDGALLSPFQQAKRYAVDLPYSLRPRWVVTCNFAQFDIYDMEKPNAEPERLLLANLPDELYRLQFLVDTGSDSIRREEEISKAAGDVVGDIYAGLLGSYRDPTNPESLKSLNELCVRLVFLLYAEDANVLARLQFHDYLARHRTRARAALIDLFNVLDTPPEKRDPYLDSDLAAFPYMNGGLFADGSIEIPQLDEKTLDLILKRGSEDFDWSGISPVIFGAVFESTLNPETRRKEGMHYTSVANIHKVIDPLFLDDLTRRVDEALGGFHRAKSATSAKDNPEETSRTSRTSRETTLRALQDELAALAFLDPACGSGNFLTETYICLRRLENRIIASLQGAQGTLDLEGDAIKVSIRQFHGIEYNDFACRVAQTALWIAENQMLRETATLLHRNLDFLPLKTYDGIVEGNALRIDWQSLLAAPGSAGSGSAGILPAASHDRAQPAPAGEPPAPRQPAPRQPAQHFSYVIGNPPFVGARLMAAAQKADLEAVFGHKWPGLGNLDYVSGWYKLAADYMAAHPAARTALVSTNSVTQGEAPAALWKPLVERHGAEIDFAHRTFRWDSESNSKAHVHCVIIGFHCAADAPGSAGILPAASPGSAGILPAANPGSAGILPAASPGSAGILPAASPGSAGILPAEPEPQPPPRAGSPRSQAPSRSRDGIPDWHDRHYVPHRENKRLQTITFRLFDSLPQDVVSAMKRELACLETLSDETEKARRAAELRKSIDRYEDAGYGSCLLRDARVAQVVADALRHFDGERYRLVSFCVMPNHVHVLVETFGEWSLSQILHSWRSYTANEANRILGRTGPFWMAEYFDRFVRNEEHLHNALAYIRMNPVKAGLVSAPAAWPWSWESAAPGSAGISGSAGILPAEPAPQPPPPRAGSPRSQGVILPAEPAPPPPPRAGSPRSQAYKLLFEGDRVSRVSHVNAYLLPAPDVFVESRRSAVSAPRPLVFGSMPNDGGFLSDWSPERRAEVLAKWPQAEPLFRRIVGSHEYINGVERWCLWLKGANPALVRSVPPVMEAVERVRDMRLASKRAATHKLAETPTLFGEIRQPESGNYIIVPGVSSERRRYVPMGFLGADIVSNNAVLLVPDATLYHFGVLTSNVHMAWMRAVAGRLKSDYRYSAQIVYNNFPWPEGKGETIDGRRPTTSATADISTCRMSKVAPDVGCRMSNVAAITATAQMILDARARYPGASLADLYDELTMPPDLRRAHQENDRAVMAAYGFPKNMTESECVAALFERYQALAASRS